MYGTDDLECVLWFCSSHFESFYPLHAISHGSCAHALFPRIIALLHFVHYSLHCTDSGIVRLSLRAQLTARRVSFNCNELEGIVLEHESKLWLDECVLFHAVGAGIHMNSGCKCLLTRTTILDCGNGDDEVNYGQGAIVIYGTEMNYAEHLVLSMFDFSSFNPQCILYIFYLFTI